MSAMQAANKLRTAFTKGAGPSFGLWQMIPGANVSRVLARSPGVDWILVDCEHGNIDGELNCFIRAVLMLNAEFED